MHEVEKLPKSSSRKNKAELDSIINAYGDRMPEEALNLLLALALKMGDEAERQYEIASILNTLTNRLYP